MKKMFFWLLFVFLYNSLAAMDLTQKQLWAIALTGIMSERNRSNHNTLNSSAINNINKNIWLEVLRRDWGINNRNELLDTLNVMENDGHASSLKLIQQIISEEIVSAIREKENILVITKENIYELSTRHYNYLYFAYSNWDKFKNRTILAWDLGRNIALCRWGYDVGFLIEEEAWEKIVYYAKLIQPLYNSWEEYGYDYYMGRVFWASGFGEAARYDTETYPIYQKLIDNNGLWHNLEWNIDLD
jgi:hypothetical protein